MYSQYRHTTDINSHLLYDLTNALMSEIERGHYNHEVIDNILSHILSKLQPWILTIFAIFGVYFILIIAVLVLILRHDIKK